MASGAGHTAVVTLLLDHGANVHAVNKVSIGMLIWGMFRVMYGFVNLQEIPLLLIY